MQVQELGHIVLYVRDLERSARFYREVLGWRQIAGQPIQELPFPAAAFAAPGGRTHHELLLIEVGPQAAAQPAGRRVGLYHFGLKIGDDPSESSVEVDIETGSIDTRDEKRDDHLRSPDFFDAENFPSISYKSTGVSHRKGNRWQVEGDLTIKGVTRQVPLEVEFEGVTQDPWGNSRAGFTASAQIDREAFGLTWNQALETGGFVVGKDVKIEIELETIRQA